MRLASLFLSLTFLMATGFNAQYAGINADGSDPDASAMLHVKSSNKGLLISQIALTTVNDATIIPTPATSLLVYNTETVAGLTPGYYYNAGTTATPDWTRLATGILDGSETKVTPGTNVTITGSGTTASPYVINATGASGSATLTIGQSYLGGTIFWLDATGQHGLIAATTDQSAAMRWFNGTNINTNAVRDGVGAGKFDTERIIAAQSQGAYAAQLCSNYQGDNYGDWYLPSKYELNLLYLQKALVGGFANARYWSSGERSTANAWFQDFTDGVQNFISINATLHVRAVRAF